MVMIINYESDEEWVFFFLFLRWTQIQTFVEQCPTCRGILISASLARLFPEGNVKKIGEVLASLACWQ